MTQFLKKKLVFGLKELKKKGALDLAFLHLNKVSQKAIDISYKTDERLSQIVSFVISSIITRITKE